MRNSEGFTLVELLIAMAVFSFMLLIISVGFMNVVRLHNQAVAMNVAQDNARNVMQELVRAVRDSAGVTQPAGTAGTSSAVLCLSSATGAQRAYYVDTTAQALFKADGCAPPYQNAAQVSSGDVLVPDFSVKLLAAGPGVKKPEVRMSLTVASNNGTTTGSGQAIACGPSNIERAFCSVVTLTSGAAPR